MIAQPYRFRGHNSVHAVYGRSTTYRGSLLNLKHVPAKTDRPYRAAVVVSKKVHKSAVVRNRIRRRVYETVRLHAAASPLQGDFVFIVYSEQLASLASPRVQAAVNDLLVRAEQGRSYSQQG